MTEQESNEPEVVVPEAAEESEESDRDTVTSPSKVLRIGSMIKTLLDEVKASNLDEASRVRLKEIYDTSIAQLSEVMSDDLVEELKTFSLPFGPDDVPSEAELRVAQAQLVGWLEGLFHGIQATLFAQQMAARGQLEDMRGRGLPQSRIEGSVGGGNYL